MTGDLLFLAVKTFKGKTRDTKGTKVGATGDLATLTATTGKDMYKAKASIVVTKLTLGGTIEHAIVELKANGTSIEIADIYINDEIFQPNSSVDHAAATMAACPFEFKWVGKVASTQIMKIEVTTCSTNITVNGTLEVFEETTGIDPLADFK